MKNNLYLKELPSHCYQNCPLCGERQVIMMRGLTQDLETADMRMTPDKGYSFCNCRNIFFTDWENIRLRNYNHEYYQKFQGASTEYISKFEAKKFMEILDRLGVSHKTILEIGCVTDNVLDVFKEGGYDTHGLDIINHPSKHAFTVKNFEDYKPLIAECGVIWASHVLEHFKDPVAQLHKIKLMLKPGGYAYIAMPDSFFVDFEADLQQAWDWVVTEHHILWNMDDFIKLAEEIGFNVVYKERCTDLFQEKAGYQFWKQDFKVILQCPK